MGKNNKAQRTKNNARPSSSGRSAELLGNSASTFVGFAGVKDGGYVPVLPTVNIDDMDTTIDPNFQLLLKKMTKKDSTTKLKALQEFSELVQNSDVESLKAVLPYWPRLYCLLALDLDHRVREGLHQAQHTVVVKAKRNIAPYLKQLVGPWFTSQYDTYPPAASAAVLAFRDAFPANKLLEAITFCQHEILAYVYDQLFEQTAQTLGCGNTTISPEELEAKHLRILVSSLQGYALYLQKMPPEQIEAALDANNKIVQSKKFWKFAKHSSPLVRQGWYTCVVALCQKSPDLLAPQAGVVVLSVLANLDEQDPSVLPTVWDAALHVITVVKDCWSHVSVDKLVLPKLWSLLRNAGHGNAGAILPSLLPFISKLPSAVTTDNRLTFYDKFFDNLRTGFTSKMSVQSQSECNAIATCYVECIRYCILKNQDDTEFCQHIVNTQLLEAVKLVLTDVRLNLLSTPLSHHTCQLLHHWDRTGSPLLQLFWPAIGRLHLDLLRCDPIGLEPATQPGDWLLARQVDFCLSAKCTQVMRATNQRVRFTGQDTVAVDKAAAALPPSPDSSAGFAASLLDLATSIAASYFASSRLTSTPHYLPSLSRLASSFDTAQLFGALGTPLVGLYRNTLRDWLRDEAMGVEQTWHLTFLLLAHLDEGDKTVVLEDLTELCDGPSVVQCLTAAVAHREQESVRRFLHSAAVTQALTSLTEAVVVNKALAGAKDLILLLCTTRTDGSDLVMSPQALSNVVRVLSATINTTTSQTLSLALSETLFTAPLSDQTTASLTLLLALFAASHTRPTPLIRKAVEEGVGAYARAGLTDRLMKAVAEHVLKQLGDNTRAVKLDPLIDATWHLLLASSTDGGGSVGAVDSLLRLMEPPALRPWTRTLNAICASCTVLINSKHADSTESSSGITFLECLELYVTLAGFTASLASKLFDPESCGATITLNTLSGHVSRVVSAIAVCQSVASRYASTVYNHRLSARHAVLHKNFTALLNCADPKDVQLYLGEMVRHRHLILSETDQSRLNVHGCLLVDVQQAADNITALFNTRQDIVALSVAPTLPTERPEKLLYDCDVSKESRAAVEEIATLARRYSLLLESKDKLVIETLTSNVNLATQIDFVFISLASWFLSVKKSRHNLLAKSTNRMLPACPPTNRRPADRLAKDDADDDAHDTDDVTHDLDDDIHDTDDDAHEADDDVHNTDDDAHGVDDDAHGADDDTHEADDDVHNTDDDVHNADGDAHGADDDIHIADDDALDVQIVDVMETHNVNVFTINVCKLLTSLEGFLKSEDERTKDLRDEWKAVFQQEVVDILVETFIMIANESLKPAGLSLLDVPVLEQLGVALQRAGPACFNKVDLLLNTCFKVMCSPVVALQMTAYHILMGLVPSLVSRDAEVLAYVEDPATGEYNLRHFLPLLAETDAVLSATLDGVRLGDRCPVAPHTSGASGAGAHLMMWTAVLDLCATADSQLRCQYAIMLRESGLLASALKNVFRLMPDQVLDVSDVKSKSLRLSELFSTPPQLVHCQPWTTAVFIEHTACWVYWLSLCHLPAEVRTWWSGSEQRCSGLVERITTRYVSPTLCDQEMQQVQSRMQSHATKYDNMKIRVHANVREVSAVYTVDEARMELVMALPSNYPLGLVKIDTPHNVVGTNQSRTWLMQLTMFLTCQNGSLWNGLSLWKSNLDKRFEGIEECYICFSVLSGANFQLPKVCCRTCKKKFHSGCLYKWFSTSNKSTCPICRNLF